MKIDWAQKLSSRKFWTAIIGVAAAVLLLLGADDLTTEHVIGLISAIGVLIAYILGESYVDGKRLENEIKPTEVGDLASQIGFDLEED